MVMRHHEEQRLKEERARREEQAKLRRVAAAIAKEVKQFWSNVEKVRGGLGGPGGGKGGAKGGPRGLWVPVLTHWVPLGAIADLLGAIGCHC